MTKKRFIQIFIASIVLIFAIVSQVGQTKTKSYYSGDAYYYNGQFYVATANTGYLEVFRLNGSKLDAIFKFKPVWKTGMLTASFTDVVLSGENGRLYAYASSGNHLYKYDLTEPGNSRLAFETADTSWDWYGRLEIFDGHLVTLGSKAVKIWSNDLRVTDSFNVSNTTNPYNVRLSSDNKFIFNINGSNVTVFDKGYRRVIRNFSLYSNNTTGNRRLAYDDGANMIYAIDDKGLKQYSLSGDIYKSLRHDSGFGYDAVLSSDENYLYVSNGTSVAKLNKSNFKFAAALENRDVNQPGLWAMGLDSALTDDGDKIAVFDNSGILVLDKNMKLLASVRNTEEAAPESEQPKTNLYINLDKSRGAAWSDVLVSGGGYLANEDLEIKFADRVYTAKADSEGRYSKVVPVPTIKANRADIKVTGKKSGLSYSASFIIEQPKY